MTSASRRPPRPARPHIPPTLYLLCGCVAAAQACLAWGHATSPVPLLGAIGAFTLLTLFLYRSGGLRFRAAALLGSCLALCASITALSSLLEVSRMEATAQALSSSSVSGFSFVISSDPSSGLSGYRSRAQVWGDGGRMGDVWLVTAERPEMGSRLVVVGRFSQNEGEYGLSSRRQGICGSVRAVRVCSEEAPGGLRAWLNSARADVLGRMEPGEGEAGALLAASVCGDREAMRQMGLDELFSACGVAHLVAVSGAHIAILSALLGRVLSQTRLPPGVRAAILLGTTGLFVLFCGAPVSAIRAWLMSAASFGSTAAGRRSHALSAVLAVALLMCALSPAVTGQLSYLLSVTSVVGLCLLSPYASYALAVLAPVPPPPRRLPGSVRNRFWHFYEGLRDTLSATLVAQLVTLPLTCAVFSQISLVAPLSNVVVAPLFTLFVGSGLLFCCTSAVWPVARPLLLFARAVGSLMIACLRWLSSLPFASLYVEDNNMIWTLLCAALVTLILVAWPEVSRRRVAAFSASVAAVLLCLVFRWRFFAPARVCVLDVGQGDAILVQDGASAILVDTGPDESCAAELARLHVMHLDAVVITHLHDDHYGGIGYLGPSIPCEKVIVAEGVAENLGDGLSGDVAALARKGVSEVGEGDVLHVGGFELTVLWPVEPVDGAENEDSLELYVEYDVGGATMTGLLTGDAESDVTGEVLARSKVGPIDFLKVGHHGSEASITAAEAGELRPLVAVASAGEDNAYGHPTSSCIETLEGAGALFLCTKDVGTVYIRPAAEGVGVEVAGTPPHTL